MNNNLENRDIQKISGAGSVKALKIILLLSLVVNFIVIFAGYILLDYLSKKQGGGMGATMIYIYFIGVLIVTNFIIIFSIVRKKQQIFPNKLLILLLIINLFGVLILGSILPVLVNLIYNPDFSVENLLQSYAVAIIFFLMSAAVLIVPILPLAIIIILFILIVKFIKIIKK
jgi:uncharacterized protein involved in response to NO